MSGKLSLDAELFRELLESVDDFVVVVDEGLRVRFVNFTGEGYRLEDVLGVDASEFVDPDYRDRHRIRLRRVWEHGTPETFSVPGRGEPGEREWYSGRVSPINREGKRVGLLILMRNVTELHRAQMEADNLRRLLPVCPWCRQKVRDESEQWVTLERYLTSTEDVFVTHGMCPDCGEDMVDEVRKE